LIGLVICFGCVIGALGFIQLTVLDFVLLFLLGLGNGYFAIILFTWIQSRTPKNMLGRMMSLITFSSTGLAPISQAVSGAICKIDLTVLFVLSGSLVIIVAFWMIFHPDTKFFISSLAKNPAGS